MLGFAKYFSGIQRLSSGRLQFILSIFYACYSLVVTSFWMDMESKNTEKSNIRTPSEDQSQSEDLKHERLVDSYFESTIVQCFKTCFSVSDYEVNEIPISDLFEICPRQIIIQMRLTVSCKKYICI